MHDDPNLIAAQTVRLTHVADRLPTRFEDLQAEASREGYRSLSRLRDEWDAGTMRFDRAGELLLAAHLGEQLAGVGGLTLDTAMPGTLRMRRFYVRVTVRHRGIGRALATALIAQVPPTCASITVNAGTPAAHEFWEALGFQPDRLDSRTHILTATAYRT